MTYDELPRWMRIWIVLALTFVVFAVAACLVIGILENRASRNAAYAAPCCLAEQVVPRAA